VILRGAKGGEVVAAVSAHPAGWPARRSLAISLSVMLEGWTEGAAPGIGPMGNVLKAGVLDLQARSWAEYGATEGAWRLLDCLARANAKAVFYTSGLLAERHIPLMQAIRDGGHCVAAHGWSQEIIPAYQAPDAEAADIARCVRAIEAATGLRPRGWLSPRCTPSPSTAELLAASGFAWHADYFDRDLPSRLDTDAGPITAMPFTMEVNDMPLYVRYGNEPEAFTRILGRILAGWPDLAPRPACLDITVHAHVFGRPYGAIEFSRSIALARACPEAWLTTHEELAGLVT
jgi:hypothetical protein